MVLKIRVSMDKTSSLLLLLSLLCHLASANVERPLTGITAVFAFGDSTLDSGNNNRLLTLVRADHSPYGQDFPGGVATGRFSNGRLMTDYLVTTLGIKDLLPPYAVVDTLTTDDVATGLSFASAGSGLDDLTATIAGVASMGQQVSDFRRYLERLRQVSGGEAEVNRLLGEALFVVGIGSNDMMMNYYTLPNRRMNFTIARYHGFLLQRLD